MENKMITIDSLEFQLNLLPAIKALRLDKKIVSLLLPALGGVDEFSLDAEINLTTALGALSTSLMNMNDEDFINLVIEMCSSTIHIPVGATPIEISSQADINQIFKGSITTIYKLLWEIMKFNKFSPFVVAGGGFGMSKMFSSEKENTKTVKSGNELETLVDSTEN